MTTTKTTIEMQSPKDAEQTIRYGLLKESTRLFKVAGPRRIRNESFMHQVRVFTGGIVRITAVPTVIVASGPGMIESSDTALSVGDVVSIEGREYSIEHDVEIGIYVS